jgi:hypothetical protein
MTYSTEVILLRTSLRKYDLEPDLELAICAANQQMPLSNEAASVLYSTRLLLVLPGTFCLFLACHPILLRQ